MTRHATAMDHAATHHSQTSTDRPKSAVAVLEIQSLPFNWGTGATKDLGCDSGCSRVSIGDPRTAGKALRG